MIWIRVDANSEIGMGHMMRCISIALEIKKKGQDVCFVLADDVATELLRSKALDYIVLKSDYRHLEREADILCSLIKKYHPIVMLIDSYNVTYDYLSRVRECVHIAYLDDLALFSYPVDILFNYNIYANKDMYEECVGVKTTYMLGPQYAPVRNEFADVIYTVEPVVKNILITTGGSDKYNLAGVILDAIISDLQLEEIHCNVISGVFNKHLSLLKQVAAQNKNVTIYENISNVSDIMKQCDLAISAAGTTMYELAAIGVPTITFSFVDNQRMAAKAFDKTGIAVSAGHFVMGEEITFQNNICRYLRELCFDFEKRSAMRKCARRLVDGKGAMHIAEELMQYVNG